MFYLHVSNRTENLLRHLAEVIRVDKRGDLFKGEMFLIQSQGMERMIAQSLADEFTSFCNFSFFLPIDFLSYVAEKLGQQTDSKPFDRRILTWRLEELLQDLSAEVYLPVRNYLQGDNRELKRFQLAVRLAYIFDQYQIMRSEMVLGWAEGRVATENPAEKWQLHLWQRLLGKSGDDVHRATLFYKTIEHLQNQKNLKQFLPSRISIVGVNTLPPIYLEFLNQLATHVDVHLFLLSPCRHYWGNVESKKKRLQRMGTPGPQPESVDGDESHPLLVSLGQQGKDLQKLMLQTAQFGLEFESYTGPVARPVDDAGKVSQLSLLQQVQADLLEAEVPQVAGQRFVHDSSIQIVSCHSKIRELQVAKDNLLNLLHNDPAIQLRDVVVMAPDIQEYAALIPAVFHDIQHSIADRSSRHRNPLLGAFLLFLELFKGRFGWSEVMDLLEQPGVYPQFQLTQVDVETLKRWVKEAGVRWGLSAQHRSENGLGDLQETTWRAGLDRLLMGYSIDTEEFIEGVLPYPHIEGRAGQPLGGLCQFIDLLDRARKEVKQPRTLTAWSELLGRYCDELFGEGYDQNLLELRTLVTELADTISGYHISVVSFEVISYWVSVSAQERRTSSGFLRGQLTFCSMLPMRSIPFQVVCLLGLNDTVFPQKDRHDTFDLMTENYRVGDRSGRSDDRYQFLEAILAARKHLYLSYIGRSIKNNEVIPPSVVVTELLEFLETGYGVEDLVIHHPLHPFSHKYFSTSDQHLFSYNRQLCDVAKRLHQTPDEPQPWWQGTLVKELSTVQVSELLQFFQNPQRYFVKNCLGIELRNRDRTIEDRELFALDGLGKYLVEQQMVDRGMSEDVDELLPKLQAEGIWPLGSPGKELFTSKSQEVRNYLLLVAGQGMGARSGSIPIDLVIDPYRLQGELANNYENGTMLLRYGQLRGKDLLAAWLHHVLATNNFGNSHRTVLVASDIVIEFFAQSTGPSLYELITLFEAGSKAPSPLFVEPAFIYAKQKANKRARISPLDKAQKVLLEYLEKGYEPELELLSGSSHGSCEYIRLGKSFEEVCEQTLCPLWEAARG